MRTGIITLLGVLLVAIFLTGCNTQASQENLTRNAANDLGAQERNVAIDKLEIYHFHGTNQCVSCITVGDYAEETVYTHFARELESGLIVFDHIDGDLPENKELVTKYGATGSSLWLGTYKGDSFNPEQNVQVWYKIRDKEAYMGYLKGVIEQKLAGN